MPVVDQRALGQAACLLVVAGILAGAIWGASPAAAGTCPDVRFLTVDGQVYRGEPLPDGGALSTGTPVAAAELEAATSEDRCERGVTEVSAVAIHGVDATVALAVQGQPGWIYVLGYRCEGLAGIDRLRCLERPLLLGGAAYYARRYPPENGPRKRFSPDEPAGAGMLGDEQVAAFTIAGVDPAVAVVVESRPEEVYVASEACLYVPSDNRPRYDGLARCLAAPVWLLFDPPLARVDQSVSARGDRRVEPELDGSSVSLVPAIGGDALPRDLSEATSIGTIDVAPDGTATLRFEVPERLEAAVYESVVRCDSCARLEQPTVFPAGVFVVTAGERGMGQGPTVALVLGLFALGVVASVVFLLRARERPRRGEGRGRGDVG